MGLCKQQNIIFTLYKHDQHFWIVKLIQCVHSSYFDNIQAFLYWQSQYRMPSIKSPTKLSQIHVNILNYFFGEDSLPRILSFVHSLIGTKSKAVWLARDKINLVCASKCLMGGFGTQQTQNI